jgi:lipoprotein-anchoring transpeptidase ErfK/SrfK
MYHKELVTHVLHKRSEGKDDDQIQSELREDGWTKKDIELALYYSNHPEQVKHFSLKRLFQSEVPESTFLVTILVGIIAIGSLYVQQKQEPVTYELITPAGATVKDVPFTYGIQALLSNPDFFAKIKGQLVEKNITFIEVDLSTMIARVYKNGKIAVEVPVKTKGKEGSWWETPAGLYKIETKEKNHYSSMGHVYQPWSMQFQGNFFIHGWPHYDDGTPVSSSYSGGCVRLADDDAKKLFDNVTIGTPILVYEKDFIPDSYTYTEIKPQVTGASFMAADLLNNYIFFDKQRDAQVDGRVITKLMTALVATEYINIEKTTTVPEKALVETKVPRLSPGMKISVYQLLFPLLRESSNEAAEAIALLYGRSNFIHHMNEKAKAIGMTHTTFVDPTGLSSKNTSTAEDVFMLAKYIYNNRSFLLGVTSGKIKTATYGESIFADLGVANELYGNELFFGGVSEQYSDKTSSNLSIMTIPMGGSKRPILLLSLVSEDSKKDINTTLHFLTSRYK